MSLPAPSPLRNNLTYLCLVALVEFLRHPTYDDTCQQPELAPKIPFAEASSKFSTTTHQPESALWVDKYHPERFLDLLTDNVRHICII